jgi:hypothetical protein
MKRARTDILKGSTCEIILNVGGTRFSTCLVTLRNCPEGLLAKRFQEGFREDNLFIDRDPNGFQSILNWLRSLRVDASLNTVEALLDFRAEAMYYCLGGLVAAVDAKIKRVRQKQRFVSIVSSKTIEGLQRLIKGIEKRNKRSVSIVSVQQVHTEIVALIK